MATNTYLNPSTLAPEYNWKPQGFLAGVMAGERHDDYRQSMDDQFAMQKIGLEDAGIDLSEKKAGLPLADMQRQVKMRTSRGQLPFAEQLAGETSKAEIASAGMEQLIKGPEGRQNQKEIWDNQRKQNLLQQRKREISLTDSLLQATKGMSPSDAQAYMERQYKIYKDKGYDLPSALLDSRQHGTLRRALVESTEYVRAMEEAEKKEAAKTQRQRETDFTSRYNTRMRKDQAEAVAKINADAKKDASTLTPNKAVTIMLRTEPGSPKHEEAKKFIEVEATSKLTLDKMPMGMFQEYLSQVTAAKTSEEKALIDAKYLNRLLYQKYPMLEPGRQAAPPPTGGGTPPPQSSGGGGDPLGMR